MDYRPLEEVRKQWDTAEVATAPRQKNETTKRCTTCLPDLCCRRCMKKGKWCACDVAGMETVRVLAWNGKDIHPRLSFKK